MLIYASRTALLAGVALFLLARSHVGALAVVFALAVVAPATDALLARDAGAGMATVGRHVAIAGYLLITAVLLARTARTPARGPVVSVTAER